MISEDLYQQYEDDYPAEFEKFTRRAPRDSKQVKSTKHDEINAKRRERQNEKEALAAKQDDNIVIFG